MAISIPSPMPESCSRRCAEVILIDDGVFRYSSLAAGVLGGQYTPEEAMLDSGAQQDLMS